MSYELWAEIVWQPSNYTTAQGILAIEIPQRTTLLSAMYRQKPI